MINKNINFRYKMLLALCLLIIIIIISIVSGTANISIIESIKIIASRVPLVKEFVDIDKIKETHITIVMNLRLPRIILALIAGVGLSVAGCIYQGVFSNPMADPYLIGVSSGAALGATLAILFNMENSVLRFSIVNISAFIGSISILVLVFFISKVKGRIPTIALILSGVAINYFISSFIALLMLFNKEKLETVYFWTLGSFRNANWTENTILIIVTLSIIMIIRKYYMELNMIMVNEEQAKTLGVDTEKVKKILLMSSSLMVAFIVSTCGTIGFVGLIVPHAARIIVGPNNNKLLLFSAVLGGGFMIISDTIARSVLTNAEISVGLVTSLFGVPFFLMLLYKNKKNIF